MFEHHTKTKGDLGVLKAQLDLFQRGYLILNPLTEHAPFDIVAYKDYKFIRIQVKYKSLVNGTLTVSFRSSYCNSNGVISKDIDKNEIDYYCVYCPDTDKCYYFNPKDYNKTITLRNNKTVNNQSNGVHYLVDFENII